MRNFAAYILILSAFIFSCKKPTVNRPPCMPQVLDIQKDTSFLSTPLVIPTHLFENKLNETIHRDFLNDNDFESENSNGNADKYKLKVSRLGDIKVLWKNNTAKYSVPVHVLLERQIVSKRRLNLPKSLVIKTEFSLHIAFETTLNLDNQWKLVPKTNFHSFFWLSDVKILGGLIDIKKMVERRMMRQLPQIESNMDSVIRASIHLDKVISKVWVDIQKPMRINKREESVWLQIHPIRFEMGKITTENKNLMIQCRLFATTETLIGKTPDYSVDSTLPSLVLRKSLPDTAYISLLSEIPFSDINKVLTKKLTDTTFEISGNKIRVKRAEISGCDSNLVLRLSIAGAVRGDIYFSGVPNYEPDSQRIVVKNFNFEVSTEEFLLGTADWLMHDSFKQYIESALSLELADKIALIPSKIMEGLEQGKSGNKMDIIIQEWDFKPQKIWVRESDIAIFIVVHAKARIELEKL